MFIISIYYFNNIEYLFIIFIIYILYTIFFIINFIIQLYNCIFKITFTFSAIEPSAWICVQCEKRCPWEITLLKHIKLECNKDTAFGCQKCGKYFKNKQQYQFHLKWKNCQNL